MKQIIDYPNYAVTENGKVWSFRSEKYLTVQEYFNKQTVHLYYDGLEFCKQVGRLVYETFNGGLLENENVVHIDGNSLNNSLDNLEVLTKSQLSKKTVKKINSKRRKRLIYKLDIETGIYELLPWERKDQQEYQRIQKCLLRSNLSSRGYGSRGITWTL